MSKISIIIPILNEAETIENLLKYLIHNSSTKNIAELIIVDGGSTDDSKEIIAKFLSWRAQSRLINLSTSLEETSITVIHSSKGRAKQMNKGTNYATGTILYFLHADSFPPKNFDELIINEVKQGNEAGCFRLKFNHNHWWLQLVSWFTQFSWRACRGGDQSQYITKSLFHKIGGFDENFTIYEDNILINELYKRKQFKVINKQLVTSARRYKKHGIWKIQYHFLVIHLKNLFGSTAKDLNDYYLKYLA